MLEKRCSSGIFGEMDAWRLLVIQGILICAVSLCVRRDFDVFHLAACVCVRGALFGDLVRMRCLCTCGVFVHWSRSRTCHLRVARALYMCVHVRGAVS